jgi:hypothetical protein
LSFLNKAVSFIIDQVICEETAEPAGPEIDLQCREHVVSDTESEAENQCDVPTSTSSLMQREPAVFPQQPFGSPSSIGQSNSEVTHRPKAIKAKYVSLTNKKMHLYIHVILNFLVSFL